ncbi:MAG: aldo/keto reductase [Deltaproteobacteria bacterium]|nr:aldo/keto reductase [Deltaproteobacteria bacterium]
MNLTQPTVLGRTNLKVGRLGVASSYGAPCKAFEEAFERGCNYFYWGSIRKSGMGEAIKNICGRGKRNDLIIVIQSYSRSASLMELSCRRALKRLALDYGDVLLLGWYRKRPPRRILERADSMRRKGMFRFLAISSHNRKLFPKLAKENLFDIFHIRYNAAHRGAEIETFPYLQGDNRVGVVSYTATRWGQLLEEKKMPPGEPAPSASDCYRFALSHPAVDICLTGPKNLEQMREALRTLDLGPMSEDELARMRKIGNYIRGIDS